MSKNPPFLMNPNSLVRSNLRLLVWDGERVANLDFGAVFRTHSQKDADGALLPIWSPQVVVKDGEIGCRIHRDRRRVAAVERQV